MKKRSFGVINVKRDLALPAVQMDPPLCDVSIIQAIFRVVRSNLAIVKILARPKKDGTNFTSPRDLIRHSTIDFLFSLNFSFE